jgi:DNA-binding Lrp family transcriptional regulator
MDIDIDFGNRDQILNLIAHRIASINGEKKHNTGIYVTEIPHNPLTDIATIDYKEAEQRGYFKIDFLNVGIYKGVRDEQHLIDLINREPIWELLEHQEFVDQLFHVSGHSNILAKLKPRSVEQLAAILAIIRPAKRYLVNCSWDQIMKEVWIKPDNSQYFFKKSHSFSYAFAVIVHMNLLCEQLTTSS